MSTVVIRAIFVTEIKIITIITIRFTRTRTGIFKLNKNKNYMK